jgi:arginase family enzyme
MINIQTYFNPISSDLFSEKNNWEATQIGSLIDSHINDSFPDLKFTEIAFFNVNEFEGSENYASEAECSIRKFFYSYHHDKFPRVSDLGYLKMMSSRKETFEAIQNVCEFLLNNGTIPFIIGGGNDISYAVYKAYASLDKYISLTSVDSRFDIGLEKDILSSSSYFGKIIADKPNKLFHFTNLAFQSYFVSNFAKEMLNAMNFDFLRLGDLRANFSEAEPILRNTDFLSFDISAIQHSFASGNVYSSPNGLNGEESSRIMRYAGLSDKVSAVGLFEYNQDLDIRNQTAYLLAQMLWYFVDGYGIRKNELNPVLKSCIKYTVAFEDGKNEIKFFKSKNSGRWWMGVPFYKQGKRDAQMYYIACSYSDYEIANSGDIPDKWLKTFNKLC